MNKSNPSEVLNSWSSVPGRPNILVAAPTLSLFVQPLLRLGEIDKPCEVVHIEQPGDAMRLLNRAHFAVMVVDAIPGTSGLVEMVLAALATPAPPRIAVLSEHEDEALGSRVDESVVGICLVSSDLQTHRFAEQVAACGWESEKRRKTDSMPKGHAATPSSLLKAIARFNDPCWIRISKEGATADLCIENGRAVYCEAGRLSGEAAARTLLDWGACQFEYREFPAFLRSNMDRDLPTLLLMPPADGAAKGLQQKMESKPKAEVKVPTPQMVWQMPAANGSTGDTSPVTMALTQYAVTAAAEEKAEDRTEIEEPTDIPALTAALQAQPASQDPAPVLANDWADEPEEPVFDPTVPEPDIYVEEPPDLFMEETPDELDEPVLPDFSTDDTQMVAADVHSLTSEIFTSMAVLSGRGWNVEALYPPGVFFETRLLEELFSRSEDAAACHGLGSAKRVLICGADATLVVARAPGTERFLIARTKDRFFGELEESELNRLLEAVAVTAPAVSA